MPDSFTLAIFLVATMSAAGMAHVWWLKWATADVLMRPLDFGRTYRGRRIFGDNKRLRGLIALPLGSALAFALVGVLRDRMPEAVSRGLWEMSASSYAAVGLAAGLGFMLAELPNSFIKRQLGVAPGELPRHGLARTVCPMLDRVDSSLGVLVAVSLMVPTPALTWVWVLLLGPCIHAFFSALLFKLGIKGRRL